MNLMRVVVDQRKPTTSSTIRMWVNVIAGTVAAIPMIAPDLKSLLPPHFYGAMASVGLVMNAAIDLYQRSRYGKILTVEPLDEDTAVALKSMGKL